MAHQGLGPLSTRVPGGHHCNSEPGVQTTSLQLRNWGWEQQRAQACTDPSYPHESALRTYCVPSTTSCDIEPIDVAEPRSSPTPEPTVPSPELTVQTGKGQACLRKVTGDGRERSDAPGNPGLRKGRAPSSRRKQAVELHPGKERCSRPRGTVRAQRTRNCREGRGDTLPQFPHMYTDPAVPLPCMTWARHFSPSLCLTSVE